LQSNEWRTALLFGYLGSLLVPVLLDWTELTYGQQEMDTEDTSNIFYTDTGLHPDVKSNTLNLSENFGLSCIYSDRISLWMVSVVRIHFFFVAFSHFCFCCSQQFSACDFEMFVYFPDFLNIG
jgi:hypothetical protein